MIVIVTSSKCLPSPARTVIVPALSPILTSPVESTEQPSLSLEEIDHVTAPPEGSTSTLHWTLFCFHAPVLGFGGEASTEVLSADALRNTGGPA